MKSQGNSDILIVASYIDDFLYTSNNEKMTDLKKGMMKRYEMNDVGLLYHFLGMENYQYDNGVFVCQEIC